MSIKEEPKTSQIISINNRAEFQLHRSSVLAYGMRPKPRCCRGGGQERHLTCSHSEGCGTQGKQKRWNLQTFILHGLFRALSQVLIPWLGWLNDFCTSILDPWFSHQPASWWSCHETQVEASCLSLTLWSEAPLQCKRKPRRTVHLEAFCHTSHVFCVPQNFNSVINRNSSNII
jgi:hypothetical protein